MYRFAISRAISTRASFLVVCFVSLFALPLGALTMGEMALGLRLGAAEFDDVERGAVAGLVSSCSFRM